MAILGTCWSAIHAADPFSFVPDRTSRVCDPTLVTTEDSQSGSWQGLEGQIRAMMLPQPV